MKLQEKLYSDIRDSFGLKSQFTISALKTVTARYKTVKEQLFQHPYKYQDESGKWCYITKTLEWITKPVVFKRPQADLVRNRDYSFVNDSNTISVNTLKKNVSKSHLTSRNVLTITLTVHGHLALQNLYALITNGISISLQQRNTMILSARTSHPM